MNEDDGPPQVEGYEPIFAVEDLAQIYRRSVPAMATHIQWLNKTCHVFGITKGLDLCAFLAQIGHESAGLLYAREIWDPTTCHWQLKYERDQDEPWPPTPGHAANRMAWTLGNEQEHDGKRFRGGGWIQLTGRSNYTRCGARFGLTAESLEERIANPKWAALTAGWYWHDRNISEPACRGDFDQVTRCINPGMLHQMQRLALYGRAKEILNVA